MNTVTLKSISLATVFSASGIAHSGTVLDFESLEVEDNSIHGHGDFYTEDGFNLTETSVSSFGFGSFGTLESRYPGSTSLFSNTPGGTVTLVKADSGSFSLDAIDLVKLDPFNSISFSGDVNVTFNATLTGGGAASQTFTINSPQVTTFIFNSSFNSVTSVSWIQAAPCPFSSV